MTTVNTAVKAMLPNGRSDGPATITLKEENLPVDSRKLACKEIDAAYELQYKAGGIADVEEKLKGLKGKVGEHVYVVCKEAVKIAGNDLRMARAMFLALCAVAEDHIKNKHVEKKSEELPIGQLIPQWSGYKSYIAKGLEKGVDPNARNDVGNALKYATAAQYREAATTAAGGATGSQAGNSRQATGTVMELVARGWAPGLAAAMQVFTNRLNTLSKDEQERFAPRVVALAAEIDAFVKEANGTAPESTESEPELAPEEKAAMEAALEKDGAPKRVRGKQKAA